MSVKVKMSEMRAALRKLRMEHSGKAVGKMSAEEIAKEIEHHEAACKHREMKEKRMSALAKAREARIAKKGQHTMPDGTVMDNDKMRGNKKAEVKVVVKKGKEDEVETIKSRISKKKVAKNE